jgi:hypothetical protein
MRRAQLARLHYGTWRRWSDRATKLGAQLAHENSYLFVGSSGPPHMAHYAARGISRAAGIPFVMDLRDPWHGPSGEPWELTGPTWRDLTSRYERRCVESAALVVTSTAAIEADLRARYADLAPRWITVMNGADPDVRSTAPLAPCFVLLHAGQLYNGRDPRSLLKALRVAVDRLGVTPEAISLRFLGAQQYEGLPLSQLAQEANVTEFVQIDGLVPRADALRAQEESAMLVLLRQNQAECIPGKVFEYVQMSSWLLAMAEEGSASNLLLRSTAADVVDPDDVEEIASVIVRRFLEFQAGIRPGPVNADGRFDRERQAANLFEAIEQLRPASRTAVEPSATL